MNPNHYLAVAINYLYGGGRPDWRADGFIGKTLVSSSMIDRVAASLGRRLVEVPVGFKWFVPGLLDGSGPFGGEESAGASFARFDGSVWTTDKDGILLALLASEIQATTGKSPSEHYAELTARFGAPAYARIDAPANREQKAKLGALSPADVTADPCGRADHGQAHRGAGQRRQDRRAQGRHRVGVVRGSAVGHRGRLQDLRRVLPRARAPGAGAGRGPRGRQRGARRLSRRLIATRQPVGGHRVHRPVLVGGVVQTIDWTHDSSGARPRADQDLRHPSGRRPRPRHRDRGGLRAPRTQRGREDDDRRDPRGFRSRDAGEVRVLGTDPARERGVPGATGSASSLQTSARPGPVDPTRGTAHHGEGLLRPPRRRRGDRRRRARRQKADARIAGLSGGQRRRLDVGLGIVGGPELLFLDEPTTGIRPAGPARLLDPHPSARRRGHDDRADDALSRRGRRARRPRRRHRRRPPPRPRHPDGARGTARQEATVTWEEAGHPAYPATSRRRPRR
jgi:hypothetical protein